MQATFSTMPAVQATADLIRRELELESGERMVGECSVFARGDDTDISKETQRLGSNALL